MTGNNCAACFADWGRSSIILILLIAALTWQTKKLLHEVMAYVLGVSHEALSEKSI
ncbi:MAG: hypothetical protein M0Q47_11115 [Methanothrix sp.]|jgi:hypothetical protein|uniref:hypothetical protein n=1 Tax=Methanothrix sp. TaxID=90426 RepID=UPI0025F56292|nr:hypothetical protein [Methanothrix sp.]MCK9406942.1 hypothetical protein [Methanothrix sp.]